MASSKMMKGYKERYRGVQPQIKEKPEKQFTGGIIN